MEISIKHFDPSVLAKYGNFLLRNIAMARHIPYKAVQLNGLPAQPKACHYNARQYTIENTGYFFQDGWLCLEGGVDSPIVSFLAHSIVHSPTGEKLDVTPVTSLDPRPFLQAFLDEDSFVRLVTYLDKTQGRSVFSVAK